MFSTKTGMLNLLRRPLRNGYAERALLKVTQGKPPRNLACRLAPNHYQYPCGSIRDVTRYGFSMKLDISDLVQWYAYWGFRDPSHDALISLCRPGDIVLDIGANIGLTALRMSVAVGDGKVYAFEPDSKNYNDCLDHVRANDARNVECIQCALGSAEGTAKLHHAAVGNCGCAWIEKADAKDPSTVHVTTVDHFCASKGINRVDLMKIDTEGTELAVLRGARKAVERWKPRLFVEVDEDNLQRAGYSPGALWDFLVDSGYIVTHARSGRVLSSGSDFACRQFDIICETGVAPPG